MTRTSPFWYSDADIRRKTERRKSDPVPTSPWTDGALPEGGMCNIHLVPPDTLVSFFSRCISDLQALKGEDIGDYLEFGVFNGSSMGSMHIARAQAHSQNTMRLFGFDAFQGLPEGSEHEDAGVWQAGYYACSFEEMQSCLKQRDIDPDDMHWIEGWYDETLTPHLVEQFNLANPGIVFIDCDTYSSSKTVLDFIAPNINAPLIICLDDWKLNDLDLLGEGEYRAFNEFLDENPHLRARRIQSYNRKSESFLITPP
ncbi:MAG: TylF/MycF/NovP-related O-methyltransferase [Pseudomonadota bacterium]